MLFGLLVTLFVVLCLALILLVLIQKGKSSMGLGNLGGGTQLLFGGSGGQDVMQKTTWILGAIFMAGSLVLSIMKKPATSALLGTLATQQAPTIPVPGFKKPEQPKAEAPASEAPEATPQAQKPA